MDIETLKKLVSCLEFGLIKGVSMKIEKIGFAEDGRQLYRLDLVYREFKSSDVPPSDDLDLEGLDED